MNTTNVEISGITCIDCPWGDMSVPFEDYPHYIDEPCPNCGSNLLTQEGYNMCINLYKAVYYYDAIADILKWFNPMFYWRLIFGDKRRQETISLTESVSYYLRTRIT